MRYGFFTTFAPDYTFRDACALAKEVGYQGIQPRIVVSNSYDPSKPLNPWGNNKHGILEADFFAKPKEVLKPVWDNGLEVTSVASYANLEDLKRARKLIKACGEAGIRAMRIAPLHPAAEPLLFDANKVIEDTQKQLKKVLPNSRAAGVRLCFELHPGGICASASAAVRFLERFDPTDVGVLYDPGNLVGEGYEVPRMALSILGPYLAEIHMKNGKWVETGKGPDGEALWSAKSCRIEEGSYPLADLYAALAALDYKGWLVEEGHEPGISTRDRLVNVLKWCRAYENRARSKRA
jgi:sugar phosphate isomerase/epimerase